MGKIIDKKYLGYIYYSNQSEVIDIIDGEGDQPPAYQVIENQYYLF